MYKIKILQHVLLLYYSVRYLRNEIENTHGSPHPLPLFELGYTLTKGGPAFIPDLDPSSESSLVALLESIIVDIYSISDMIVRVSSPEQDEDPPPETEEKTPTYESKKFSNFWLN